VIAVLFEVWPSEGGRDEYLEIAASLRPLVERVDGFLGVERFQSLTEPDKLLSLSLFRDEAAVAAWRGTEAHVAAQARGKGGLFRDYRIRVAPVVREYGLHTPHPARIER
jgi:heme-degrading monooxygenase HmoA